jgi:hypothetical protein
MDNPLANMGIFGIILALIWAVPGLLMPFFIWGIYNQTKRTADQVSRIRTLLENQIRDLR